MNLALVPTLKEHLRRWLRSRGFDVRKISVESDSFRQLAVALAKFEVDLVFDIGANQGQFATALRAAGYDGPIVSFEPLSTPHAQLATRAAGVPGWQVHPRSALGDRDGEIVINVAGNSLSSSALPMLSLHEAAAADSAYVGTETAPLIRLDSIAEHYLAGMKRPFLKIDAQGYEWPILDGAAKVLPRLSGVLCELSLLPLYEGQRLWLETIERLEGLGFTLWSLNQGFTDPRDGRTLQMDATLFRA